MGQVSVKEARQLVAKHEVEVIDLRDEDDWVDGHIPGAHRAGDDIEAKLEEIDGERKLLIVCADGKRSAEVADELGSDDREAVSLEGGMKAWLSEGMPSQPTGDYEPGPAPVEDEDEDSEQATEKAEGTIDPDEDPEDPEESEESGSGAGEHEADASVEAPPQEAEDGAGEPIEGAPGEESPQEERGP